MLDLRAHTIARRRKASAGAAAVTPPQAGIVVARRRREPAGLDDGLRERQVASDVLGRALLDDVARRLKDLDVERTEKAELFLRVWEDNASYSNRLISEGTLRVLGLLAVLSPTCGSATIGYEEPENGVHPRRLRNIAELLRNAADGTRQILINTHSPILPTYFRNDNLLVCRRVAGATEFVPFTSLGEMFRPNEIASHLEEQIIRGDYGG